MGQQASAAGQAGQSGTSQGAFSEDAFRHFKDNRGGWAQNNANQMPSHNNNNGNQQHSGYDNSNNFNKNDQQSLANPMHSAMMNGVSGMANSCLYTDITRPNGPMGRTPPMDMERRPGNRDSFSTHNLNQSPVYSSPPPPAKAEASTMMSTAFLQRSCPAEEGHGGIVQFKIDTVHEDVQVSESHIASPRESSAAEREVQVLEEKLRCAKEKALEEEDARRRRGGGGGSSGSQKEEARRGGGGGGCAREEAQCHHNVGTATYDEVPSQEPYGMVTNDMPILVPPMYSTPQKAPSAPQALGASVERRQSADIDMCSGFESHLTSISQQRPQQTPAASVVGSCASRAMNVVDELKERESWSVGSVLEVHSSSAAKWYIAQLVEVGEKATSHMVTVQFVGDTGQIMQKSMPRSDVQLAVFGRNTRQMPPNFQKVASQSRPGQFSYEDSSSGAKYQTKDLAWQNYYAAILQSEQAQQLLKQQSLRSAPSAEATAMERLAAEKLKPASLQPAPTMSLTPTPQKAKASDLSSDFYVGAHGPDPMLAHTAAFQPANAATPAHHHASQQMPRAFSDAGGYDDTGSNVGMQRASYRNVSTVGDLRSLPSASPQQKPQMVGDLSSLAKSKTPFPGYGQSFAVGSNAGYEAYLASQGKS